MFKQDMAIKEIIWPDGSLISMQQDTVKQMNIEMESGQYSMVPWIKVVRTDGNGSMHNAAHIDSIRVD